MKQDQDLLLGRKVVEAGFLRQDQVDVYLRQVDEEAKGGQPRRFLGKVLVERGLLTFDQMVGLLRSEDVKPDHEVQAHGTLLLEVPLPRPTSAPLPPRQPSEDELRQMQRMLDPGTSEFRVAPADVPAALRPTPTAQEAASPLVPGFQAPAPASAPRRPTAFPPPSAPPAPQDSMATLTDFGGSPAQPSAPPAPPRRPTAFPPPSAPPAAQDSMATLTDFGGSPAQPSAPPAPPRRPTAFPPPSAPPATQDSMATLTDFGGAPAQPPTPVTIRRPTAFPPPVSGPPAVSVPSSSSSMASLAGLVASTGPARPPAPPAAEPARRMASLADLVASTSPARPPAPPPEAPEPRMARPAPAGLNLPAPPGDADAETVISELPAELLRQIGPRPAEAVERSGVFDPAIAQSGIATEKWTPPLPANLPTERWPSGAPADPVAATMWADPTTGAPVALAPSAPAVPPAAAQAVRATPVPQATTPNAETIIHFGPIPTGADAIPVAPGGTGAAPMPSSPQAPSDSTMTSLGMLASSVSGTRSPVQASAVMATRGSGAAAATGFAATQGGDAIQQSAVAGTQQPIDRSSAGGTTGRRTVGPVGAAEKVSMFGRYQLLKELARGAMGIVYVALDPTLKRKVALKVMISAEAASGDMAKRFKREAMMAAKVRHPNIVQVYDVGEVDGKLYYTMELIEGDSLQGSIKKMGRLQPRMALKICRDAARALQAAHEVDLIHRDIKPANIMLAPREKHRGEVESSEETLVQIGDLKTSAFRTLVADFGIAKDLTAQTMMTKAGSVVGTPAYMSPEQAGEPEKIGAKSDIYSLGVVLYHILAGSTPFTDPDPIRLLAAVISQDPPTLRVKAPELALDLETIVMKAMEKDQARRYETAAAFADDMDRYLSGEMIKAQPSSRWYRFRRALSRNRHIILPLVAAMLISVSALAYFTLWPQVQQYYADQQAAMARHARENDAQSRLSRALAAVEGMHWDDAMVEAKDVVQRYDKFGRRGENVGIPQAHDVLARCFSEKGEPTQALLERFRAYRSAIGVANSDRYLLRTVRELVRQLRYDEATSLLTRVVRSTRDDSVRAEAHFWLGRSAEGVMDFRPAMGHFDRALRSAGLPEELRSDCQEHRTFCASLAFESPLPLPITQLATGDLDRNQRKELYGIGGNEVRFDSVRAGGAVEQSRVDANQVYVGVVGPKGFEEKGRIALDTGEKFGLSTLRVLDFPDAEHPTVVVAGGNAAQRIGKLYLLRRGEKDVLTLVASTPLESPAGDFAAGDLDGDGKPELLVGTGADERALRVYSWDEAARSLTLEAKIGVGGDVTQVDALDFNGDGQQEAVVFAGAWQTYGASVYRFNPIKDELSCAFTAHLGVPMSLARVDRPGKLPLFFAGVGWDRQMVYPLRKIHGPAVFEERYRAPGAYILEPKSDFTFTRRTLVALDWAKGKQGRTGVIRTRGRAGDFLWCNVSYQGPWDPAPPPGTPGAIHVFRTEDDLRTFAILLPRVGSSVKIGGPMWSVDIDEDGMDEVVVASDRSLVYFDALDKADQAGAGSDNASEQQSGPSSEDWVAKDPLLDFGTDAEKVGLTEEALSAYSECALVSTRLTEVEEATRGQMRCLLALGKVFDAIAVAKDVASRFPPLEIPILREGVRLLDRSHRWAEAHRLAARLLQAVDLTNEDRLRLGREAEVYHAISEMVQRVVLVGPRAAAVDCLATSPLPILLNPDGSWRIYASSDSQDRFFVPFSNSAESCRLLGSVEVLRHEWGVGLRLGVGSFDPLTARGENPTFPALALSARGNKNYPLYTLDLESPHPAAPRVERVGESGDAWQRVLELDLTVVAHQNGLLGRVAGLSPAGKVDECEIEALVSRADTILAGLEFAGTAGPGHWGVFQVSRLELQSASDRVLPATYGPLSAIDHLLLANGRWVQGRTADALALYDKAIRLADRERAKEEQVRADGLPSLWDRSSPNDVSPWVYADARFYRGLLRIVLEDGAGGQGDLDAAWQASANRVRVLLRRYALPLHFRAQEKDALRAFWRRIAGDPGADAKQGWVQKTFDELGAETAELLVEGVEVIDLTHPEIRAVGVGSPADRALMQVGDAILRIDDQPVATGAELKASILAAMAANRDQVQIEIQRGGRVIRFPVEAKDLGVEVQEVPFREVRVR